MLYKNENIKKLSDEFIGYINANFTREDDNVFTLIRGFKYFLRDYLGYASDQRLDIFNKLLAEVTNEEDIYELDLKEKILITDSLINNSDLKELWLTYSFNHILDHTRLPLSSGNLSSLNERIHNQSLKNKILNISDYYAYFQENGVWFDESVKNTDHLNDVEDMSALFNKLTEPYRGKVIYVDFWGTWCRPCRENIKLSESIKKEFKGKDIIYMYLANSSPEKTWISLLKEMNLTGENIVHYRLPDRQQANLEKFMSIYSFPTYMLIDKEGNIVNRSAPSPRDRKSLVNQLNDLLIN